MPKPPQFSPKHIHLIACLFLSYSSWFRDFCLPVNCLTCSHLTISIQVQYKSIFARLCDNPSFASTQHHTLHTSRRKFTFMHEWQLSGSGNGEQLLNFLHPLVILSALATSAPPPPHHLPSKQENSNRIRSQHWSLSTHIPALCFHRLSYRPRLEL